MKKLFTIIATLFITISSLNAQSFGQMDIGYSSKSINLKPVFGFSFGYVFCSNEYVIRPIAEAGIRGHTDRQSDGPVYGHLSAGIQLNKFLQLTAGIAYGANQQKQDRHISNDTVIILTPGAVKETYVTYKIAIKGTQRIIDGMYVVEEVSYMHNIPFASIGIKFKL